MTKFHITIQYRDQEPRPILVGMTRGEVVAALNAYKSHDNKMTARVVRS